MSCPGWNCIYEINMFYSFPIKSTYLKLKIHPAFEIIAKLYWPLFYISLSEVNAGFFYHNAEQREQMVAAERRSVDERVQKVIDLKKKVIGFFWNAELHNYIWF